MGGDQFKSQAGNPPALACEQWEELWSVGRSMQNPQRSYLEQRTGLSGTLEIADVGAQMLRRYRGSSLRLYVVTPPSEESTSDGGTTWSWASLSWR